ncbi:MAG: putative transport system ATP-binding protein, partial [Bryobacterales bacterium]|nr:putative transport system ATP-binding protein [Bryobacterales bacterium]
TRRGITVVLITHDHQVAEYASRIITFKDGRIVNDRGNPRQRRAEQELSHMPETMEELA